MAHINTPRGPLYFKPQVLYLGIKKINPDIAAENLLTLKDILDSEDIPFLLTYGTLLGIVRDNAFIRHDEDIDIVLKEEYRNDFLNILPVLFSNDFKLVRYDRRGLLSLMRKGEYIDIYLFKNHPGGARYCSGGLIPDEFFETPDTVEFLGKSFQTHSHHIDFLIYMYGQEWSTPVVWNDYNTPLWKIELIKLKEYFKELLPDSLYLRLARSSEKEITERCSARIKRYNAIKQVRDSGTSEI